MADMRRLDYNWPIIGGLLVLLIAAVAMIVLASNRPAPDRKAAEAAVARMDQAAAAYNARRAEQQAVIMMDPPTEVPVTGVDDLEPDLTDPPVVAAPLGEPVPLDLAEPPATAPR